MVEKTLVASSNDPHADFYETVRQAVVELDRVYGPMYFAMIVRFEDAQTDDWVLLLGAERFGDDPHASMHEVVRTLKDALPATRAERIARVGFVAKGDPFYEKVSGAMRVARGGLASLRDCRFNSIAIRNGAVFISEREMPGDAAAEAS